MRVRNWGIALFFSALSLPSFALPKVTTEYINGFQIDFVDIGAGDRMSVTYYLPVGTLHNRGRTMGLAHLFEHFVHDGSVLLPGSEALNDLDARIGAQANAQTTYDHTYYFAAASQNFARDLLLGHLGMLSGLEWNEKTFESEKGTVINEIAVESMAQDYDAFSQMQFTKLLADGHPWKRPILGSRESLKALTLDDLRDYYYSNYTPENVKIAIHGNFSNPEFFEQVKAWSAEFLHPALESKDAGNFKSRSPPLSSTPTPSLFKSQIRPVESAKRLYVHSKNLKYLQTVFESTSSFPARRWHIADLVAHYLNLTAPGTLAYALQTQLQWITSGGYLIYRLNDRAYISYVATPTDEGLKHLDEINRMVMQQLRSVQLHGLPVELLELLKRDELFSWDMATKSVGTVQAPYMTILDEDSSLELQKKKIEAISNADIRDLLSRFDPAHALYSVMGPDPGGLTIDAEYDRGFILQDNRSALKEFKRIFNGEPKELFQPPLTAFELELPPPKPFQKKFAQSKPVPGLAERLTLDFRNDLPNLSARTGLRLAARSPANLVFLDLLISAFTERYSGHMLYAKLSHQMLGSLSRLENVLWINAGGDSRNSISYAKWLMDAFAKFEPTHEELERARVQKLNGHAERYSASYSADVAIEENSAQMNPLNFSNSQAVNILKSINFQEQLTDWRNWRVRADREFILVGDLRDSDYETLKKAAAHFSPLPLSKEDHTFLSGRFAWSDQSQDVKVHWPLNGRSPKNFGATRTYKGPSVLNYRESVAFVALMSTWSNQINNLNRNERSLGYMQSAYAAVPDGKNYFLTFYGMAEGPEDLAMVIDGWETVIQSLRTGLTTDEKIRGGISAAQVAFGQKQLEAEGIAAIYSTQQNLRYDARARLKLVRELETLTPEDVRAVARKYIFQDGTPYVQLTVGGSCDLALTGS